MSPLRRELELNDLRAAQADPFRPASLSPCRPVGGNGGDGHGGGHGFGPNGRPAALSLGCPAKASGYGSVSEPHPKLFHIT